LVAEDDRVQRSNSSGAGKGFYTLPEAAKVLEVGQRRILQMLETKELEGEQDPVSDRWKIAKHAVDKLAPEEPPDAKEPPLTESLPVSEKDTAELPVAEETLATEERPDTQKPLRANQQPQNDVTEKSSEQHTEEIREPIEALERLEGEQQAEKAAWQEEKEHLLATADRERQHAKALQEEIERLSAELASLRERKGELESVNEHLQREQQAEKATWKQEKGALLAAANRELQHTEELQKEITRLRSELEDTWGLAGKLEQVNERLKLEQQAEEAAWQEEKRTLLAEVHEDREHAEALQEEVERLSTELEAERSKGLWRRLSGG
jgi:DNA repair exonuclease SbcCD ATPase subunit